MGRDGSISMGRGGVFSVFTGVGDTGDAFVTLLKLYT